MENWILLAIIAGLLSTAANFFHRFILKDGDDATSYAWFYELTFMIFFGFLFLFDFRIQLDLKTILSLMLLGLVEFGSVYTGMKTHSFTHLSISTIVTRLRILWVPFIAFFIFNESLRPVQYLGLIVLFIGISIAISPRKLLADKGIRYALLFSFLTAVMVILMKYLSPATSPSVTLSTMSIPSLILIPIFMNNSRKRLHATFKIKFGWKILANVTHAIAAYLLILALKNGSAGVVSGIHQGMIIISVLAGIILLKEKEDWQRKIIGAVITVAGVLLLTLI